MLSTLLFLAFSSFYIWLFYKPRSTSAATTTVRDSVPETFPETPSVNLKSEAVDTAAVADEPETAPISEASTEEEVDIEPVLTEEEAIALAVETTLAADDALKDSEEDSPAELIRPNPPDPELVEVAIRDALEKSEDFSPPETDETEPPSEVPVEPRAS